MFNLIMQVQTWIEGRETAALGRIFEHTDNQLKAKYVKDGEPDVQRLIKYPCLFMEEGSGDQLARVGQITEARVKGPIVYFEFSFDRNIPPIPNSVIHSNMLDFDITHEFEFGRTHWALKDANLYRTLLRIAKPRRQQPRVFAVSEHEKITPTLVAVMMPFGAEFARIYKAIQAAAYDVNLTCRRADEIWEDTTIIQDVVSLIDRARVVVCDCTDKNPNVFYEIGIAHTLGREVIMITQNEADVPFDLRHHRYIKYLNNTEGLRALSAALEGRLRDLTNR